MLFPVLYSRNLYDITYVWNLKYDTNEIIYETDSDLTFKNSSNCTVESGP